MLDFTVAIRTYNNASTLSLLLDQLQAQIWTDAIAWEIVIVDNNSSDHTAEVIERYRRQWTRCELRYVFEPCQGAAIARRRAINEARGTWIGFLDDDNLPTPTWIADAIAFTKRHPTVAAFGGRILPQYEVEPPRSFERIAYYLPIALESKSFCYRDHPKRGFPVGAGLVIGRQIWLDHVPDRQLIQGPVGTGFALKGEEIEALSHIRRANGEIWYNGEMAIMHCIGKQRMERSYLLNFFRVIGLSQHRFRMLRLVPWQRPFFFPLFVINDLRRIVLLYLRYRLVLKTEIAAECEWQLALYRLVSPFYIWQNLIVARSSNLITIPGNLSAIEQQSSIT